MLILSSWLGSVFELIHVLECRISAFLKENSDLLRSRVLKNK